MFSRSLRSLRTLPSSTSPSLVRPLSTASRLFAHQGYGDGKGDPRGEDPQAQGSSNATKHNAEHPGPEPPSAGQGTGGATKAGDSSSSGPKDPAEASAQSGGSRSKEAKETGSSPTGGAVPDGKRSYSTTAVRRMAEPKITSAATTEPGANADANSREKQAEVEQHNREFEDGHDRASKGTEDPKDQVDKKFWKGQGGADRQP